MSDGCLTNKGKGRLVGRGWGFSVPEFLTFTTDLDVSLNSGTPKSSILIGFFHYKPSILGYHYFWKHLFVW